MSIQITNVRARQIYDSRGNPTVEVDITTQQGQFRACVPSGASTGVYEALELRDKGERHHGKGVDTAVNNVNTTIAQWIVGKDPRDQEAIDKHMVEQLDGARNEWGWSKANLGANAILGVSLAVARAGAAANGVPLYQHIANLAGNPEVVLPVPAFNIINGGSHAGNALPMQEFMILPTGADSFREAMMIGSEVYHHLKKVIKERYGADAVNVGDEGGFAPNIQDYNECWELIQTAIANSGHAEKVQYGMDVAASEFYNKETQKYDIDKWKTLEENAEKKLMDAEELRGLYQQWCEQYPLVSIEDGFDEDDWDGWQAHKGAAGDSIQLVGDDLLVTNVERIKKALEVNACNALLLKVNQIGTLTEAIEAVKMAKENKWGVMTSHRSGETEDTFIADLAVGLSTGQIKTGAPCRSERLAKYNQLLRIEEELGDRAQYAGRNFRHPSTWLMGDRE